MLQQTDSLIGGGSIPLKPRPQSRLVVSLDQAWAAAMLFAQGGQVLIELLGHQE